MKRKAKTKATEASQPADIKAKAAEASLPTDNKAQTTAAGRTADIKTADAGRPADTKGKVAAEVRPEDTNAKAAEADLPEDVKEKAAADKPKSTRVKAAAEVNPVGIEAAEDRAKDPEATAAAAVKNNRRSPAMKTVKAGKNEPRSRKSSSKNVESALTGTVPEWANSTVIAQLLGKTTRRVQQLTQDGILETEIPPGGGARKYRTCETVQRYIGHVEQKAKETGESGKQAALELKKLEAEVELKESQGNLHKLKTAIAEGKYIPAEQAREEVEAFMLVFQRFASAIPSRMTGAMAGYADPATARAMEKAMRRELESMMATFANAAVTESETVEPL